jgi:beta-lactamase regulating signal transducer with metallopeptidase domain
MLDFLTSAITSDLVTRLSESLLHFVWQGGVLAMVAMLGDRCLRRHTAQSRYVFHISVLVLMLACVPATFVMLRGPYNDMPLASTETVRNNSDRTSPAETSSPEIAVALNLTEVGNNNPVGHAEPTSNQWIERAGNQLRSFVRRSAPFATAGYLFGVVLMFARLGMALYAERRLRREASLVTNADLLAMLSRQAKRIGLRTVPLMAWCNRTSAPLVAGLFKPMILLPTVLASGLSPDQLESLLVHELAHVQRFDLLVNLLQRIAEALLFFHPAVWYVSRRISGERENCCDDTVLRAGWGSVEYADALVKMAELAAGLRGIENSTATALLAATGRQPSQFKQRILRLLGDNEQARVGLARSSLLAILGVVLAGGLAGSTLHSAQPSVAVDDVRPNSTAPVENEPEPEIPPGHFLVSFRETPWQEVMQWYGRVIGTQIDFEAVPPGNFSYENPRPLNHSEIMQLMKGELHRRGFCFVGSGDRLSIESADYLARKYEKSLRDNFLHGRKLREGPDRFDSFFDIVEVRNVGNTKPPAPSGPAIAFVLKASRDFTAQEATDFWRSCIFENSMTSLKTGQPIVVDGFAVLHDGKWLGTNVPALKKGEPVEIWLNEFEEWNARPPADLRVVIEGRLVGEEGKPVVGRLQQFLLEGADEGADPDLAQFLNWAYAGKLNVDKQGKFQVVLRHGSQFVRKAYLYATAPGYAPRRVGPIKVGYNQPAVPLTIELNRGFTGRLRLVLPDGKRLDQGIVEVAAQDDLQAEAMPMAKLPINGQPILVPHCPTGPLLLKVRVPGFAEQEIRDMRLDPDRAIDVKVPIRFPATMGLLRGKQALDMIGTMKPAWSVAKNGIEFGISHIGDKRQFRAGERVPLAMFIRNVGDKPMRFELGCDFLWNVPEVRDAQGQPVPVERVFAAGSVALLKQTLNPGEVFGFQHLGIGLGTNPNPGENWNPYWVKPARGAFTIRHQHTITTIQPDDPVDNQSERYESGSIDFEVID